MSRSRSLKDSSLDEAHERSIPPKLRIGLVCSPIGNSEDPDYGETVAARIPDDLACHFQRLCDERADILEPILFRQL